MRRIMTLVAVALAMVAMMSLSGVALAKDVFPILNFNNRGDCKEQPDGSLNCNGSLAQVFVPSPGDTSISAFGIHQTFSPEGDVTTSGGGSGTAGSGQAPNPSGIGAHCTTENPEDPCDGGGTSNAPQLP
jgi:hypothetical protein